jgi:hypothetical protein
MASSTASIFYWVQSGNATNPVGPFQLGVATASGIPFRVEYRDNLDPGTPWQLLTNLTGNGTNFIMFDPNPNPSRRFYRIPLEPDE